MPILEAIARVWRGTHAWRCGDITIVRAAEKPLGIPNASAAPFIITSRENVLHVGPLTLQYLYALAREQQGQGIDVRVAPVRRVRAQAELSASN